MFHTLETPVPQHREENILAEIQLLEGLINTAQSNLDSLTAVKRDLEMTIREVARVGVDATDLRREIAGLAASVVKAAERLAQARAAEPAIQRFKAELRSGSGVVTDLSTSIVKADRHPEPAIQRVKEESRVTRTPTWEELNEVHFQ